MPQKFQVLRCYKCSVFQGHQTTKSNKWACKLCGEKQSFKRFYGLGTAKECRFQVQKLNGLRGQLEEMKNNTNENSNSNKNEEIVTEPVKNNKPIQNSKWSNYVDETEAVEEITNENDLLGGPQVIFQRPIKRRKQSSNNFQTNPVLTPKEGNNYKNSPASPKIEPNSLNFSKLIEPKSKPPQPDYNFEDSIPREEPLNIIKQNNLNKFVLPVSNKNSRWAQFTDEPHETDQNDSILTQQNDMLFSCSDDADIEAILGI